MKIDCKQWMKMLGIIVDSNQVFFWEWRANDQELITSQEMTQLLYDQNDRMVTEASSEDEEALLGQLRSWMLNHSDDMVSKGSIDSIEIRLSGFDESDYWVKISGTVIVSDGGKKISIIGTMQNITYLKRWNEFCQGHQQFLESLLELIPYPVFYKNNRGVYEFCNERFSRYLKLSKEEIIGKTVFDIAPADLAEIYYRADQELMRSGEIQKYESQVFSHDGRRHDVDFTKSVYRDKNGKVMGLMGLLFDITEEKHEKNRVYRQEAIRELFLKISQMISQTVDEGNLFERLIEGLVMLFEDADYGSILEIVEDQTLHSIASYGYIEKGNRIFEIPLRDSYIYRLSEGDISKPRILRNILSLHETFPENLMGIDGGVANTVFFIPVVIDESKKLIICLDSKKADGFDNRELEIAEFITIQMPILYKVFQMNQKTVEMSRYDGLTGFHKREYFQVLFQDRLSLAKRNKDQFLVVMMDLDGLKKINDQYGHQGGDEYIIQFSRHIRDYFRESDIFSRIGGDEFIGLFNASDCEHMMERLEEFKQLFMTLPIEIEGHRFYGSFSYGVSVYPDEGETRKELIRIADSKMYQNKRNRK